MKGFPKFLVVVGRIFISLIFIITGIYLILHWQESERAMTAALNIWHSHSTPAGSSSHFWATLLLWVPVLLIIGIIFSLLGGLMLFFGAKVRFASFLLVLLILPWTFIYHQFWYVEGDRIMQTSLFFKNLAILGGLLYVLAVGGKKKSSKPAVPATPPPPAQR